MNKSYFHDILHVYILRIVFLYLQSFSNFEFEFILF